MQSILVSELLLSDCPIEAALHLIATNDTRRCTCCFTWFMNLPSIAENRTFLSSSLHADLQRWIAGRARDTCPTCQQEKAALAHIKGKRVLTAEKTAALQAEEGASERRYRARRDVDLYQALRAFGSKLLALPPRAYSDINSLLTWRQERVLFHVLQDLGAFQYPGMAEGCFRDGLGRSVPDEKIYEIIRQRDIRWNMYRGWVKDGLRVSFEMPVVEVVQKDHALVARGRGAKRWRGRGMYRKWAPRMDRGKFELEPIVEGDEMEAAIDEMWSYKIRNRTGTRLMAKDLKSAKNFSRSFGVQKEERPKRAVLGRVEATRQVQHVSASRREVVGSNGGRRRLTKAAPY